MEQTLYSITGADIVKRGETYYLRFDAGEGFLIDQRDSPISQAEAAWAIGDRQRLLLLVEICHERAHGRLHRLDHGQWGDATT